MGSLKKFIILPSSKGDDKMSAIQQFSRYDVLISQFPFRENQINSKDNESLIRIFHFLHKNTDIQYIAFLKEETLGRYLEYHCSKQFEIISFVQAIQDIKIFIFYMQNSRSINKKIQLDLSLKNYNFWINL